LKTLQLASVASGATPTPQWAFDDAAASAAQCVPCSESASAGAEMAQDSLAEILAKSGWPSSTPSSLT